MDIRNLLATGYVPDCERRPFHQGRDAETPTETEGNLTYAGSYPKASTCLNRIGMDARIHGVDASNPESLQVGMPLKATFLHLEEEGRPITYLAFEPA